MDQEAGLLRGKLRVPAFVALIVLSVGYSLYASLATRISRLEIVVLGLGTVVIAWLAFGLFARGKRLVWPLVFVSVAAIAITIVLALAVHGSGG
jgi:hypothetical protein